MIKIENLSRTFYTEELETTALNKVNLQINEKEFVAIMGPSGCGKSTLLNVLGLVDNSAEGQYYFEGQDLQKLSTSKKTEFRRDNIGFIFQNFNLIDELNVFENIELPLRYQKRDKQFRDQAVNNVLERMGIAHRKKHNVSQLSGGQQQRVAVARALVTNPKLILADEPTGNLDSKNGDDVMQMLEQLNKEGATIIMVTHSPTDAQKAHRIINLFDGKIVDEPIKV
ncbi:ABC transporter ATP-binding protein [Gaetbulibacter jejuensis]|uniref:ABC transporter ATP-binding protein n=1 Tax=Gaetbulibacter jejuensis TaxID=584607 RepID=A0ABP3UTK5_9FLAO